MSDHAEDMRLAPVIINRIAHRLPVDGQPLVSSGKLRIPLLQSTVECRRIDTDQYIADTGATRNLVAAMAIVAVKASTSLLAQVPGPFTCAL